MLGSENLAGDDGAAESCRLAGVGTTVRGVGNLEAINEFQSSDVGPRGGVDNSVMLFTTGFGILFLGV